MSLKAIAEWDGTVEPIGTSALKADPEFAALPPAGKISAINRLQGQWADTLRSEDPKGYGGIVRQLETDFDATRRSIFEDGLAEDLKAGALSEEEAQKLVKQGYSGLNGKAAYAEERYGPEQELSGPWTTQKMPLTGADGKARGFMHVRKAPGETGRAEVSWTVNADDGQISGTDDVDISDFLAGQEKEVAEAVTPSIAATAFAATNPVAMTALAASRAANAPANQAKVEGLDALKKLRETNPEAYAAHAAATLFSKKAQENPEISDKLGQGFLEGLGGQAAKGFLKLGASATYGVPALFGSKEAAESYREGVEEIEGDIEGQSRLGFRGGFWDKIAMGVTEEIAPMALSMGAGLAASGARRLATAATEKAAEAFLKQAGVKSLETASPTLRALAGGFGKLAGTAKIEGKLAQNLADRVTNALAFLPSSMRSGLDAAAVTYDEAEKARAAGDEAKAQALEEKAALNMWAATSIETLSENLWLNEMMITRAGRKFGDVATDVLSRRLGDATKMERITGRIKDSLATVVKFAGQEGIEEVVAGVGNRAWMNTFAEQNKDLFEGVEEEFVTGAVMGGLMGAAKSLAADGKPEMMGELMKRGLDGDTAAAESWQRIQARKAELDTPAIQSAIEADAAEPFGVSATEEEAPAPAVPAVTPLPIPDGIPAETPDAAVPQAFAAPEPSPDAPLTPADAAADAMEVSEALAENPHTQATAAALAAIAGESAPTISATEPESLIDGVNPSRGSNVPGPPEEGGTLGSAVGASVAQGEPENRVVSSLHESAPAGEPSTPAQNEEIQVAPQETPGLETPAPAEEEKVDGAGGSQGVGAKLTAPQSVAAPEGAAESVFERAARETRTVYNKAVSDAGDANAVELESPSFPGMRVVISRDPENPAKWRASRFDKRGAAGHNLFESREKAIADYTGGYGQSHPSFGSDFKVVRVKSGKQVTSSKKREAPRASHEYQTTLRGDNFEIKHSSSGATVVGYYRNQDFPNDKNAPNRGEVFLTEVPIAARKKGIGYALTERAIQTLHAEGADTVNMSPKTPGGVRIVEKLIENGVIGNALRTSQTGKSEHQIYPDKVSQQSFRKQSPTQPANEKEEARQGEVLLETESPAPADPSAVQLTMPDGSTQSVSPTSKAIEEHQNIRNWLAALKDCLG